jgi:CHAT domain-containing protein
LILTGADGGPADLFMYQVADIKLRRDALVVLSACETGYGSIRRAAGTISLAWGFLVAGARTVVATLWRIEDEPAANVMIDFHAHLAAGQDPIAALRAAQVSALRQGTNWQWAAFEVIGVAARR